MDFEFWQTLISTSPGLAIALIALYFMVRWNDTQVKREKDRDDADEKEALRREQVWKNLIERSDVQAQREKEFSDRQVKFLEGRIVALETKLAKKDEEISKLRVGIDTLTTDLKEALEDMGRLEKEKSELETRLTTVVDDRERVRNERDELSTTVEKLSDRLRLVEEVQRKGDTDQLNAAKVEEKEAEAKDKAA